ncbi:MAG: tetratricopeptide repeat protein [Pseudomonadota bacterium]
MALLFIGIIGLLALIAVYVIARPPMAGMQLIAAALFLGIAGYAWQGSPTLESANKAPREEAAEADEALLATRNAMGERFGDAQQWLILADAQSRQGKYTAAAKVLRNAVKDHPENVDLWVALGNALVGHSDGLLTPASQFAFQRAATLSPEHPAPPFFMGLSLAQSGRLEDARAIWKELYDRSPEDAPWRADLEQRLARIDSMIGPTQLPGQGTDKKPESGSPDTEQPEA